MKKAILISLLMATLGCGQKADRKTELLDSLKRVYADKPIHLQMNNNEARTTPITTQYAYVDRKKTDLAFDLKKYEKYKLSSEEGDLFVPTQNHPTRELSDMVLIEAYGEYGGKQTVLDRGFVSYRYIAEFYEASNYDKNGGH